MSCRCGQPAGPKCGSCNSISYCSRECQIGDWKNHREECHKKTLDIIASKINSDLSADDFDKWKAMASEFVIIEIEDYKSPDKLVVNPGHDLIIHVFDGEPTIKAYRATSEVGRKYLQPALLKYKNTFKWNIFISPIIS